MTQEEIQQRNEQIALLLGWRKHKLERNWFWNKKKMTYYRGPNKVTWNTIRVYIEYFKFHSDWNWLMEAVEFVKKTSGISMVQGPVKKPTCVIHLGDLKALSGQSNTLKEAAFIAVSDFAKLYNDKKL